MIMRRRAGRANYQTGARTMAINPSCRLDRRPKSRSGQRPLFWPTAAGFRGFHLSQTFSVALRIVCLASASRSLATHTQTEVGAGGRGQRSISGRRNGDGPARAVMGATGTTNAMDAQRTQRTHAAARTNGSSARQSTILPALIDTQARHQLQRATRRLHVFVI